MRFSIIACLVIPLVGACAAPTARVHDFPQVPVEETSVVIYRLNGFVNKAAFPYVYVDGEKVGTLYNAGHIMFKVLPGRHTFTLQNVVFWTGKQEWTAEVRRGSRHFYRVDSSFNSALVVRPMLVVSKTIAIEEIHEEEALRELAQTERSD